MNNTDTIILIIGLFVSLAGFITSRFNIKYTEDHREQFKNRCIQLFRSSVNVRIEDKKRKALHKLTIPMSNQIVFMARIINIQAWILIPIFLYMLYTSLT